MKVLILNGPNLNMLGKRPKEHYGSLTLKDIEEKIIIENNGFFDLDFYQSNYEGDLVSKIQESLDCFAIIINPAAYTHTSVAIHDALEMYSGYIIEVHLSKVDEREEFRKINFVRDLATTHFSGNFVNSYLDAIKYIKSLI